MRDTIFYVGGSKGGFKLHRESMRDNLDEMAALSGKQENALTATTDDAAIRAIASGIAEDMGKEISDEAKSAFNGMQEHYALRGPIVTVCFTATIATLAYWLGATQGLRLTNSGNFFDVLIARPAGWWFVFCAASYTVLWCTDNWRLVRRSAWHKIVLALQVVLIGGLLFYTVF